MRHLAESFAWCAVQVTLFSIIASLVYGTVRRLRVGAPATVLVASLAVVGLLTLMSFSPWPRWIYPEFSETRRTIAETRQLVFDVPINRGNLAVARSTMPSPAVLSADNRAIVKTMDDVPQDIAATALSSTPLIVFSAAAAVAVAIGLLRLIVAGFWLWRYHRTSVAVDDGSLRDLVTALSQKLELPRSVQLRESPSLGVAATAGWRRPYVLLPAGWRTWTADERRAVLAHELAHIKQRHFRAWLLSQLPLVAHYYHPLVHWLARRLRFEQEVAADQLAVQIFGDRRRYATILAGLALDVTPRRDLFASLGLFMSRPFLMRRIAMLCQTEISRRSSRRSQLPILLFLMLAAVAVAGLRTSRAENNDEPAVQTNSNAADPLAPVETGATLRDFAPVAPGMLDAVLKRPASKDGLAAVALFEVSRTTPSVAGSETEEDTDAAWEVLCQTQLAKLKSYFVLAKALRKPGIESLPLVRSQADPADWLAKSLDVGFFPGSEIMYVRLLGKSGERKQLEQLVNAVAKAYEEEVVYDGKSRQLMTRDLLAKSLEMLENEIKDGMALYFSLAKEQGKVESGREQVAQDIDIRRLDRIDSELMRLEDEFLSAKIYHEQEKGEVNPRERAKLQFYEQRIAQVQKRQDELGERISARSEQSVDLSMQKSDLDRLQKVADGLSLRLQMLDVDAAAPARIRLLQSAVVTGALEMPDKGAAK